ncbi:MAG: hypothetical protein IKV41_05920 [Oscillospiraceae bacterium]|nr:hypothetical protein [Oscillospiraceae bacterium]
MTTDYLAQHLQCSRTDKQDCLPMVQQLLEIAFFSRDHGLVALDKFFNAENSRFTDPFLRKAVSCLVDIADAKMIRQVMYNYILAGNYTGSQFLRNLIIADTILALHQKVDIDHIFSFLVPSYFGLEFDSTVIDMYRNYARTRNHNIEE